MKRRIICTATLAIAIGAMAPLQARADDDDKRKAAAVIGAILGAAVIAKAARDGDNARSGGQGRYHSYRYREYDRDFSDRTRSWHPARGITCFPNLHACYAEGHGYSARWTRREFH